MKPTEIIGNCELYLGDCLEVMESLGAVNHVLTDPPYEQNMHDAKRGEKVYGSQRRIRTDGHANPAPLDFSSIDGIREKATRLMGDLCNGWLLVFCTPEGVRSWRDEIEANNLKYKRACVWIKPDSAPQFNGQGPAMGCEMIVAAWAGKGHSKWNGGGKRGVFTFPCNPSDRHGVHPTEKPIQLMNELVELFTNESETILDPFMGSGTTGVSCLKRGRKFIGIEKDPKYFAVACERIEAAYKQPDLFIEHPPAKAEQTVMQLEG